MEAVSFFCINFFIFMQTFGEAIFPLKLNTLNANYMVNLRHFTLHIPLISILIFNLF